MCNSSELITLKDMAQCLSDAKALLLLGDMCPDTYIELLDDASRLISEIVTVVESQLGLELDDQDEQEVDAILNHIKVAKAHRHSLCFQGGEYGLYRALQTPCSIPGLEVWEIDTRGLRLAAERHPWSDSQYDPARGLF